MKNKSRNTLRNYSIVAFLYIITLMSACTKKPEGTITVTTKTVTDITDSSAKTGGSVTSSSYSIGDCGVCYSESHNPTLNNSFTKDQKGDGEFSSTLSDLKSGTQYYVRAYAKTSSGIEYGKEVSFTTQGGYTINVFANPTAGGTVTGAGSYQPGQTCTITATTNTGYTFTNWTENGTVVSNNESYSFTVSGSRNLQANFTLNTFTITVLAEPGDEGTVSGGGNYGYGQSCTVSATANTGYTFTNWTENGNEVSTNARYSFTVTEDRSLVAHFQVPVAPEGAIPESFSVSAVRQVWFSKGNLQYQASTNTWRFAENQWDYVGSQTPDEIGNFGGTVTGSDNGHISPTYNGWIDVFGWGTSGYNHGAVCYQPWSISANRSDYYAYGSYTYNLYDQTGQADWGCNAISNGGNTTGNWRTLTYDEWMYVLYRRGTTSDIRFAMAQVNGVNGVVLLPDAWNASYYRLNNTNDDTASFNANIINSSSWTSNLEAHGAIFLPAAGSREGTTAYGANYVGYYWSASCAGNNGNYSSSYYVFLTDTMLGITNLGGNCYGQSVRLVHSIE